MKKLNKKPDLNSEKGTATLETVPLLIIFIILISYGLGYYGAIHTGVLQSIAARQYAFETFRNRTNLNYFLENQSGLESSIFYGESQFRFHGVQSEEATADGSFKATTRPIAIGRQLERRPASQQDHNVNIYNMPYRNQGAVEVHPIWVMVGYGICLNSACGDGG